MRTEQEIKERYELFKNKRIPEALYLIDKESYAVLQTIREAVIMEYRYIFGEDFKDIAEDTLKRLNDLHS